MEEIAQLCTKLTDNENEVVNLRCEKDRLLKDLENISSKLETMTGVDKKHDLLDLELEEAETRIVLLTTQHEEITEELGVVRGKLNFEIEAKENREMQIAELEQALHKETERA